MLAKAIAIIDDEVDLATLFREVLEMEGFKVCTFTDPLEAFDRLQKRTEEYAIVISDYEMPTMNGNELCNKLIRLNPKLKVILISAYDNVECNISKFTFLHKPIPIARLLKIVKKTLAK